MPRLTKRAIDALVPVPNREQVVWDDVLPGFGLRMKPSGARSFIVQYRNSNGRSRRITVGRFGVLTAEEARSEARQLLADAARGADPAEKKSAARNAWTIKELCGDYVRQAELGNVVTRRHTSKSKTTLATDRGRIQRHIVPLLGHRVVRDLKPSDIKQFFVAVKAGKTSADVKTGLRGRAIVRGGQGTAKRTIGLLSGILSHAIELGMIERNPAHGLRLPADGRRTVNDLPSRYAALGRALLVAETRGEPWQAIEAIRLAALTGMRRGEVVTLRWDEVDLDGRLIHLANSKTGKSLRPVGETAINAMRAARVRGGSGGWVFPGVRSSETPFGGLPKAVLRIFRSSGLSEPDSVALADFCLHDLRHGFATISDGIGLTLPTVAALLGHALGGVTAGYVARVDSLLTAAADKVSKEIGDLMNDKYNQGGPSIRRSDE